MTLTFCLAHGAAHVHIPVVATLVRLSEPFYSLVCLRKSVKFQRLIVYLADNLVPATHLMIRDVAAVVVAGRLATVRDHHTRAATRGHTHVPDLVSKLYKIIYRAVLF